MTYSDKMKHWSQINQYALSNTNAEERNVVESYTAPNRRQSVVITLFDFSDLFQKSALSHSAVCACGELAVPSRLRDSWLAPGDRQCPINLQLAGWNSV